MESITRGAEVVSPLVVWEPTRACDLACLHCRSAVQPVRSRFELSTYEGYRLIDQIAELAPEEFVITGGDPLKRPDIFEYLDYARRRGLRPTVAEGATPLLNRNSIHLLKEAGAARISISVDGPDAASHDSYRGVPGLFEQTIDAIRYAGEIGLPVEVSSSLGKHNARDIGSMAKLVEDLGATTWSLFFLVPSHRGQAEQMITAEEAEDIFAALYKIRAAGRLTLKTVEGAHFHRYILQQRARETGARVQNLVEEQPPVSGSDVVFVSHIGEVYPGGFLPLSAGNVRNRPLGSIFRTSPLFVGLRDGSLLKGKCGRCEFQRVCRGSRARAWVVTGDVLAEEPICAHVPAQAGDH